MALNAIKNFSSNAWNYATPRLKAAGMYAANLAASGLAQAVQKAGLAKIDEIKRIDLSPSTIAAAKARIIQPIATPEQIRAEFEAFGMNVARIVPVRMIDKWICGSAKPEDFYIEMNAGVKTDGELRNAFYAHLDQSDLFFLVRWVAKLVYWLFFPAIKGVVQETVGKIHQHLTSQIKSSEKKEFNAALNQQMNESNRLLENWIATLHSIASNATDAQGIFPLQLALAEEIDKPEHLNGLNRDEYYKQVTQKFMRAYYPGISLGKIIADRLMSIGVPEDSAFAFLNIFIKLVTISVGAAIRLVFFLPDYIFNLIFAAVIEKALIRYRVIEDIGNMSLEAISTNKGLSLPVLKAMNEALEELYVDIKENPEDPDLTEGLIPPNKEALKRTVELALKSVDLFDQKTVGDLKKFINKGSPSSEGFIDALFDKQLAVGIEQVIMTIHKNLTNPDFLKQKSYNILQALNESLSTKPISAEEGQKECERLEKRLIDLIEAVVAESISRKVQALAVSYGAWEDGHAVKLIANQAFERAAKLIEKTRRMITSPQFTRYQMNQFLSSFLKA